VREAHLIALELHGAVPPLESKSGAPHEPEVRLKKRWIELIGDAGSPELALRLKLQPLDGQDMFFAQTEFGALIRRPSRKSRDWDEVFIVSFH
jgi:hypothetical protein